MRSKVKGPLVANEQYLDAGALGRMEGFCNFMKHTITKGNTVPSYQSASKSSRSFSSLEHLHLQVHVLTGSKVVAALPGKSYNYGTLDQRPAYLQKLYHV
jgi:hypothetical protein